jgi:hypothetical protein
MLIIGSRLRLDVSPGKKTSGSTQSMAEIAGGFPLILYALKFWYEG